MTPTPQSDRKLTFRFSLTISIHLFARSHSYLDSNRADKQVFVHYVRLFRAQNIVTSPPRLLDIIDQKEGF